MFWLKVWISKFFLSYMTQRVIGPHKCTCQIAPKFVKQFKHGTQL